MSVLGDIYYLGDFKTTNYSNNVAEIMKTISNFLLKGA